MAAGLNKIRLSTNPTDAAIAALQIGDIVYLDGTIYTAREGVYMRVIEDGVDLPLDLPAVSAANFSASRALLSSEVPPSMGGPGPETHSAASSPVPRSIEHRYPTGWSARLKSRRWWFDLSWNLASVVAMIVIALVVRNWLFNGSRNADADARRLPVVNSELATTGIENDATPRIANLQEPASRITELLPMEQDNEAMTGPLTEGAFGEYQSQPDWEGRGLEVMGVMR